MKLLGSYANEFSTSDFYMSSTENAETKYKAESYSSSSIKDKDSKTKVRAIRIFY